MPLKRRCKSCKSFFGFTQKTCPKCKSKQTYAYVVKWVNCQRYVKALHDDITKLEALAIEADWNPIENVNRPITLSKMKQRYIDKLITENKTYRQHAALFLDRFIERWGDIYIDEITPAMIREFQVYLRNMASPAYTNRYTEHIKWVYVFSVIRPVIILDRYT